MGANAVTLDIQNASVVSVELPDSYAPGADNAADKKLRLGQYGVTKILDANTTPAPAEALSLEITIDNTGSYELDLTAAPIHGAESGGAPAATEDLTGKKLMHFEFQTVENAGVITVKPSSSNGYTFLGAGITDGLKLETIDKYGRTCESSGLAAVSSTVKGITFEGTEGDVVNVKLVFE